MKLKSMKLDKADREKETMPAESVLVDQPVYPYGLSVRLDEKALEKLALDKMPAVDGELMLMARVTVTAVTSNEHSGNGGKTQKHKSLELQITDLALGDVPKEKDAATELYSKA